jgi:hypothetical protein
MQRQALRYRRVCLHYRCSNFYFHPALWRQSFSCFLADSSSYRRAPQDRNDYKFIKNKKPVRVYRQAASRIMPEWIYPGMQLRLAVSVDDQVPIQIEVPGSSGKDDENSPTRKKGIQNNFVRASVPIALSSPANTSKKSAPSIPAW